MPITKIKIINNQKQCSKCKEWKDLQKFSKHKAHQTGYRSQCTKCRSIYKKTYVYTYKGHRRSNTHNSDYKILVLKNYGEKCFCCGESNISLLNMDHINDNGKEHGTGSKHGRYKGIALYIFLVKNNYPTGIQTACFNCNIGRRINGGICPHKNK